MRIGAALRVRRSKGVRSPRNPHQTRPAAVALLAALLIILVSSLSGCTLPPFSASSAPRSTPTATPVPTVASDKGGDSSLPTLSATAAHCADLSLFKDAPPASAGPSFAELTFPQGSVSVAGATAENLYHYQIVDVCAEGSAAANTLTFYAKGMTGAGWAASATYPYGGDPKHACGDPYCWRKADKTARYVSLEHLSSNGTVTIYDLRLATGPTPSASLVVRSSGGAGRPGQAVTVSAGCAGGEQMVGGGYSISVHTYTATSSYPSDQSTWTVTVVGSGSAAFAVQTYVECLSANYSLGLQLVPANFQVASGAEPQAVSVTCPSGVAVAGGAKVSGSGAILAESSPAQGLSGWNAGVTAGSGGSQGTAYALCATANVEAPRSADGTVLMTYIPYTIDRGGDHQSSLGCAADQWLTSGGFNNSDPSADGKIVYALDAPQADGSRWFVQAHNFDASSAHGATIWAICAVPDPQF